MENQYLYHYTTIESLAQILKSKCMRFNTLLNVDDPVEVSIEDTFKIKKHFLVSCWTSSSEENMALWTQYTKDMKGCIISLPVEMFSNYKMGNTTSKEINNKIVIVKETNKVRITTPIIDLIEVEYKEKLSRPVFFQDNFLENFLPVKEKLKCWEFQKEFRFLLYQTPKSKSKYGYIDNELEKVFQDYKYFPFDFYDLKFNIDSFLKMEIILGPKCTNSDYLIVEALVEKYNKSAKIKQSKIVIKGGNNMSNLGMYHGKLYSTYCDEITGLIHDKKFEQAKVLLLEIIEIIEIESKAKNNGVAPWYYEQLANIFKKEKQIDSEIQILERYKVEKHAPGVKPQRLLDRLTELKNKKKES